MSAGAKLARRVLQMLASGDPYLPRMHSNCESGPKLHKTPCLHLKGLRFKS
jgi:hypothetical protein